eukprot:TRINITY_DN24583_c2_g1_i2.p1 TRINITY_DN24583_c2_g1~~TRINITY_DN24583_c2_g1_i2.p1  ORF type:complete len:114 (+),score=0.72 TRINITY_DN24583_c2_g1_i2:65-406(+)
MAKVKVSFQDSDLIIEYACHVHGCLASASFLDSGGGGYGFLRSVMQIASIYVAAERDGSMLSVQFLRVLTSMPASTGGQCSSMRGILIQLSTAHCCFIHVFLAASISTPLAVT